MNLMIENVSENSKVSTQHTTSNTTSNSAILCFFRSFLTKKKINLKYLLNLYIF